MKKSASILLIVITVGLIPWGGAQTSQANLFDAKKSQQELEIMRGILSTTLNFILRDIRSRSSSGKASTQEFAVTSWGHSNINAFYLYGQGASFVVPLSTLRSVLERGNRMAIATTGLEGKLATLESVESGMPMALAEARLEAASSELDARREAMDQLAQEQAEALAQNAAILASRGLGKGTGYGVGSGAGKVETVTPTPAQPAAPQASPAPPAPPKPAVVAKSRESQDALKKKLADAQERVKKRREELEALQKSFTESLGEIKGYLVEALANHGDSLTHVKPNEYINIILTSDDGGIFYLDSGEERSRREILTVQKSVITDYKAAKINMDQFKQKVLQYSN